MTNYEAEQDYLLKKDIYEKVKAAYDDALHGSWQMKDGQSSRSITPPSVGQLREQLDRSYKEMMDAYKRWKGGASCGAIRIGALM